MEEKPQGRRTALRLVGVILLSLLLAGAGWWLMRFAVKQMFEPIEMEVPQDVGEGGSAAP